MDAEDTNYAPGDVVNGHMLGADNKWHQMAPTPGDVVNGYRLGTDNQWLPLDAADTSSKVDTAPAVSQAASPAFKRGFAIVLTLGIVAGALFWIFDSRTSTTAPAVATSSFSGEVIRFNATDPATVMFQARVTNTGQAPATPQCFVRIANASQSYKGYDNFILDTPLAPGDSQVFSGVLVITGDGAAYADQSSIECESV